VAQSTTTSTERPVPSIPSVRTSVGVQSNGTATAPRVAFSPRLTSRKRVKAAEPRLRQLMGVCGWAAVLGSIALVVGIRGLIGVIADEPASWYEPAIVAVGAAWLILTVAAFLSVNRPRVPWVMLTLSSGALGVCMLLTSQAF
jgi:hypothetical protein